MPVLDQGRIVDQLLAQVRRSRTCAAARLPVSPLVVSMPPSIIRNAVHRDLGVVERLAVQRAAQDVAEQVVAQALCAALLPAAC